MKKILLTVALLSFLQNQAQKNEKLLDAINSDSIANLTLDQKKIIFSGVTNFSFNQAYFENWVSGGESSLTGLFSIDYNMNYKGNSGWVWDNNLMLSIGTTYLSGSLFFKKADDRIEINSVLSKKVNTYWNYSAYFNFRTQLLPGFRYFEKDKEEQKEKISRIFSPAIIQFGLGWYYKEDKLTWVNIAPLAARGIFVSNYYTQKLPAGKKRFGVEAGKTSIVSVGASVSGFFKSTLMDNITMENKFNFYVNYLYKIKNIDIEWNANIRLKVNDKISSSLIVHLQYDDDLVKQLQIRELFGLGLSLDI